MTNPPAARRTTERVYEGRRVAVRRDVFADAEGREFVREIVEHPGSAVIVPRRPDGAFVLVRQYRHAVGATLVELPAGTLESEEPPERCAARELEEETGWRAGKLSLLSRVYPSPGVLAETMWIYLAEDLSPGTVNRDPGEEMDLVALTEDEVRRWLREGRFEDGKTIAGLCLALERIA